MSLPSKISSDSQVPQHVVADGTKETKSIVYTQSDLQKIIPVINALITHLSAGVTS